MTSSIIQPVAPLSSVTVVASATIAIAAIPSFPAAVAGLAVDVAVAGTVPVFISWATNPGGSPATTTAGIMIPPNTARRFKIPTNAKEMSAIASSAGSSVCFTFGTFHG